MGQLLWKIAWQFIKNLNKVIISQFSHSVVSDSLRPHGLQHTRLPCPSPTPRACSNSCPSSQLSYDPAIPLPHIYSKNWKHMVTQKFVYGWSQHNYLHRHASFYCVSIYCASWIMQFLEIESLWQHYVEQIYQHNFPNSICSLLSLCHILVILAIPQAFSSLLCLLWWSVVNDLWCYYYNSLKAQIIAFFINKLFLI